MTTRVFHTRVFYTRYPVPAIRYPRFRHSTKHGLDWTELDGWTGLDSWTGQLDLTGLDSWTGLILIYIFKCFAPQSFHSRKFYVQIFTGNIVWLAICFKMGSWYTGSNPMYIFY